MAVNRSIINDAFREAGIIEAGESPTGEEFNEALRKLESCYRSALGAELGENFENLVFGTGGDQNAYSQELDERSRLEGAYLPSNTRLSCNLSAATTLYLNPNPRDGSRIAIIDQSGNFDDYNLTLKGNGRSIESESSVALSTAGVNREWFYRADLGDWVRVTDLDAEDLSPLPEEFDDYLITFLAIRINPRYGAETSQNTTEAFMRIRKLVRARYVQISEKAVDDGLVLLPSTHRQRGYSNRRAFDRGY